MKINKERVWEHIQLLKQIGLQEDGSVTRYPFTKEDEQAKQLLIQWMTDAKLDVHVDAVGNVIGTLKGSDATLLPIVCGSHFDSVKNAGAFDGCLGVIAGIEALQCMIEQKIETKRDLKVVGFRDEEGNRFGYGMVGSKSFSGMMDEAGFLSKDIQGITLGEAMEAIGYFPKDYQKCKQMVHAFFELHIEQAVQLDNNDKSIGIVEGIAGLTRYTIKMSGESAHAGATPMRCRKDCVVAMSDWIIALSDFVTNKENMVLTVGRIETHPGVCNVICEHVSFSVDLRALHDQDRETAIQWMMAYHTKLEKQYGITIEIHQEQELPSCLCDETLIHEMRTLCEEMKIPYQTLSSGAGHDAMNFKDKCPIGMIFIRSVYGYSHRKEEYSSLIDCALGTNLLYEMLLKNSLK